MAEYDELLYYEKIISDNKNKIFIWGNGKVISGFVDQEVAFSTTSTYGNELAGGDAIKSVAGAGTGVSNMTGVMSDKRLLPQALTRITWQDSTLNTLSFDIYLPSHSYDVDVMEVGKLIFDFTLPEGVGSAGAAMVWVPNHYKLNADGSQTNLLSVKIGHWFKSINSWAMTSGNLTVSKEKLKGDNTKPLYIKIAVVLQPGKQFRLQEVLRVWKVQR